MTDKAAETVTSDRMRSILVSLLNEVADTVFDGHRQAASDCVNFSFRERWLSRLVVEMGITPDEASTKLSIIHDEQVEPKDDEDARLIDTAVEFVTKEYETGKYNGRDAVGFFRTLFGRIDDDLLRRFDEARS